MYRVLGFFISSCESESGKCDKSMMTHSKCRLVRFLPPFLLSCIKFFGLIFLSYDPKTQRMRDSNHYSIAIIIALTIQSTFSIRALYRLEIAGTNHTVTKIFATYTYEAVSYYLVMVGIHSTVLWNRRQCKMLINQGLKLYSETLKFRERKGCQWDKKFIVCLIFTVTFACYSICSITSTYHMTPKFKSEKHWIRVIVTLNFIITSFINVLATLILVSVMLFSAHSLRLVNTRIQECLMVVLRSPKMSECCQLSDELDELHHLHSEIMQFTQEVNTFCAFPLFLKFLMRFLAAISEVSMCTD